MQIHDEVKAYLLIELDGNDMELLYKYCEEIALLKKENLDLRKYFNIGDKKNG